MLTFTLFLMLILWSTQPSDSCEFANNDDDTTLALHQLLNDDDVRLIEFNIRVDGYSKEFWKTVGGNRWFQPWRWYRVKGSYSERMLLLFHYYYGILKPYMGIGARDLDLHLTGGVPGCLNGLSPAALESKMREFLYYDLKNETERQATELTGDIRVCSMHIGDYDGWGRLVYRCCSREGGAPEMCSDVSDDEWVWVLRAFIVILSILVFLFFTKLIPNVGYYVYTFQYYPPDGQNFNILLTADPTKYKESRDSTVLPAARWRKLRKFAGEVSKLQPDVIHTVKIKRVTFECGMDRLLSETSSPVGVFSSIFDSCVRCKVRHADSLEECCATPLCGELCCARCPPWHAWMRALRTIVLMLLLAAPALPILYVLAADDLEFQEVARMMDERDLTQSYNFFIGGVLGKVVVAVLAGLYLLHMILVVVDGCHDQNLARAYTELLHVTRNNARLNDRMRQSQGIVRKVVWPVKRFGVLAVPLSVTLLLLLPVFLLVYVVVTSPVPKLLAHSAKLLAGKASDRKGKSKFQMSVWDLVENVLFVITLVDVFAVLTLALNFLIHVLILALVQLIVNIAFLMKFFTILVLLAVYIRDAFRLVHSTYASHQATVLGYVRALVEEDVKREADKDWRDQENKIFKIVPSSAADSKGQASKEEEAYKKKKLFLVKNDALRMRTRSLALFLDKDDIPYIPKKFLEHTTTISCPGSPGRVEEAYLRALGRFARIVVFLLLILLPLLAYASTYEISNNLQFFAILFTGTIPLVMRYFCMSPGTMLKVDTNTLRFQTQMDDKVESFMQSWVVEDVLVDHFRLPHDNDHHRKFRGEADEPKATASLKQAEEVPQPPQKPPPYASDPVLGPQESVSRKAGYLNYMIPAPEGLDMENGDDLVYLSGDPSAMQPDDGTAAGPFGQQQQQHGQRSHRAHKKEKRKKKARQNPEDDLPVQKEDDVPANKDHHVVLNGNQEWPATPDIGKKSKKAKGKKEKMRIDLVLDIREGKQSRRLAAEEEAGSARPPNIHWNRRSRLVDENKTLGEYDA